MAILASNGSNAHRWKLLIKSVCCGRRCSDLLVREPLENSDTEISQSANRKQFLLFVCADELLTKIAPITALNSWIHSTQVAPSKPIEDVDSAEIGKEYNQHDSAEEFIRVHRKRHDEL